MSSSEPIFDRTLLQTRRRRAVVGIGDYDYLLRTVADDIADRLSMVTREFPLALNWGCHNGLVTRALNELKTIGTVVSADPLVEMVDQAPGLKVVADEELFPFAAESFDLIVSALSLQWVNDLPGALIQLRAGLKPDGAFVAAILGGGSLAELRHVFLIAEEELYGGASPRVAPFADVRDFGHLLQRAGFALPVTDRDVLKVRFNSAMDLMRELKAMGASNVLTNRLRVPRSKALFERVNELYSELYSDDDGRVFASFEMIYLMGWAPHPDQQKPLRPGSAAVSLKDVFQK